ncbi:MAG: HAD family phosphatase [Bacteroides sp.]|nr:HAD family phosphatase [Eubacterium sp.]MCM1417711.1 HAD family phosphatase [Roseburia sp.]MCM1461823.1 HAD family phosphatase [Bacteroides sp.]
MKKIKAAVFDLDGTLLDSMHIWNEIDCAFLTRRGIAVPADYMLEVAHLGSYQTAIYTKNRFGLPESPDEMIAEWLEMAIRFYSEEVTLKAGAYAYLTKLNENGIKLAVATANSPDLYLPALKKTNTLRLFRAVVNIDEVERSKGFPDIYRLACERLGVSEAETAVFEDIYLGVKGAKDGGFYTVGVYDKTSAADEAKIRALADRYVRDFTELLQGEMF